MSDFDYDAAEAEEAAFENGRADGYEAALEAVVEKLSEEVEELSIKGSDGQGMVEALEIVQELLDEARQ